MKIEKIGIIGKGALGVMYGKWLAGRLGNSQVFFLADEARAEAYRASETYSNGEPCGFQYRTPAEAEPVDLIIFAVKFLGMEAAIEKARPFGGEKTVLLSVLNGVLSEQMLEKEFGAGHVVYCCVQGMDAGKDGNAVTYRNMGYISVGNPDGSRDEKLAAVTELFDRTGLSYEVPADIRRQMWSKLMLNDGVNQVTAIYKAPYRLVQKEGEARTMMVEAMREVMRTAAFEEVELTEADIASWLDLLDHLDPDGRTSMCQDIMAGRRTEKELFSGTIRRLAAEHGISVPVNDFLYEKLQELEEGMK